jgi:predicted AlkP superfamily pyrophosphatase or phosphodiesterase
MYTNCGMTSPRKVAVIVLLACLPVLSLASAYNAHPKLVVVIVIDQFRGDYLERYRDDFGEGGFRLFLDHGAYFSDCNYDYANTRTAPGHATLLTGAYSNGHGIVANEWWEPGKQKRVSSVSDDSTKLLGIEGNQAGASPRNLLADTLGDELKLATQGAARVFGIALKDRAAILTAGFAANGAFWIDPRTGVWVTSTYYGTQLPPWVQEFNQSKAAEKYLNQDWKDADGKVLRTTTPPPMGGKGSGFYSLVGSTPFANDYEFDFARELIQREKMGTGPATDLLVISLSANDILGHQVGPDSPEMKAMALAMDRQIAGFFTFLGKQFGLANIWAALSADHGVSAVPAVAAKLHIPAQGLEGAEMVSRLNDILSTHFGTRAEYLKDFDYPVAWLNEEAFAAAKVKEAEAEQAVGEALLQIGMRAYYGKWQLAHGDAPNTALGRQYLNSYSPEGTWYVLGVPPIYTVGTPSGTDHASPYQYDTHVPLAFYGVPFQPGTYRTHAEPVDLAVTLASLLGINAPTHAVGRVLTEALQPSHAPAVFRPVEKHPSMQPAGGPNQ